MGPRRAAGGADAAVSRDGDALTDAEATPGIDKMVEAIKAEGEETFRRKIEYLAEFGRTIGIPDVDSQVLSR